MYEKKGIKPRLGPAFLIQPHLFWFSKGNVSRGSVRSSPAHLQGTAPVWGVPLALQRRARRPAAGTDSGASGGCKMSPGFSRSLGLCISGLIMILLLEGEREIISPRSAEMQTCKALCSIKKTRQGSLSSFWSCRCACNCTACIWLFPPNFTQRDEY